MTTATEKKCLRCPNVLSRRGGRGLCRDCYTKVRRWGQLHLYATTKGKGHETVTPPPGGVRVCTGGCGRGLVPKNTWRAIPKEERPKNLAEHLGLGLCNKCYLRAARDGTIKPKTGTAQSRDEIKQSSVEFPLDVLFPCRDESVDADWWFSYNDDDTDLAKTICKSCPFTAKCLQMGIEREERWGVFGGEVLHKGRIVPFQREHYSDALSGDRSGFQTRKESVA